MRGGKKSKDKAPLLGRNKKIKMNSRATNRVKARATGNTERGEISLPPIFLK